jgi:predicted dehydrogenase
LRRVKLGIIGTGLAARDLHLQPLKQLADRFEIVALCNRTRSKAEAFRELVGGDPRITTEYRELLSWPEVEAVDIALPIVLNEPVTVDALRAGKHVFLEKPIGHTLEAGRHVVEEADRHPDLVLLVAENVRYEERFRTAHRLLGEGRIGRPMLVLAEVLSPISPASPYTATTWRMHPEHIGGYLSDGGVHQVAALQVVAGPVREVQGLIADMRSGDDQEDTMLANLRFESGAIGHLTYSVGVLQRDEPPIRIHGTRGSMAIHRRQIVIADGDGAEETLDVSNTPSAYVEEFRDFYRAVAEGTPPEVTPRQALSDLAVIDAAFLSSSAGTTVQIEV